MMTRIEKANWLRALRSGKYKRGERSLMFEKFEYKLFCCLGVKCDIENPTGWARVRNGRKFSMGGTESGYMNGVSSLFIPGPLRTIKKSDREQLSAMNDAGMRFKEIAQWIRKNLSAQEKVNA